MRNGVSLKWWPIPVSPQVDVTTFVSSGPVKLTPGKSMPNKSSFQVRSMRFVDLEYTGAVTFEVVVLYIYIINAFTCGNL